MHGDRLDLDGLRGAVLLVHGSLFDQLQDGSAVDEAAEDRVDVVQVRQLVHRNKKLRRAQQR